MSRRAHRWRTALALAFVSSALAAAGCSTDGSESAATQETLTPGATWPSGVWLGGAMNDREVRSFGRWRGLAVDTVTTYPAYESWDQIKQSDWHVSTFNGFQGRLVYGLPLLPEGKGDSLKQVAAGRHDAVWRAVARTMVRHGRGHSFVRIGLEANGTWFPWGATADTAQDFRAAYRRVERVMSSVAPRLVFVFDISCGVALKGAEDDRMASLEMLYPGDDSVDVIGCDHYDSWTAIARTDAEWNDSVSPKAGPGLTDVVRFARQHDKRFAVPEWGLSSRRAHGSGDNPFFMRKMFEFFTANRDRLAFENYFDEPDPYLGSSLYQRPQNPRSAKVYRQLW